VACIVFVGLDAISAGQSLLGDADPVEPPGSLRADPGLDTQCARAFDPAYPRARGTAGRVCT
jgi:hypothetical protein